MHLLFKLFKKYFQKDHGIIKISVIFSSSESHPNFKIVLQFGVIYAGAQKNIGPSGITLVIVREDLIGYAMPITPSVFDFAVIAKDNSVYNTPPTFM